MLRPALAAGLLAAGLLVPAAVAHSCGDKYLVPGRGPGFATSMRALRVLIFENSSSPAAMAVSRSGVERTLKQVGYKVVTCGDPADCASAAGDGKFDIILAGLSDAKDLRTKSAQVSPQPAIVPLLLKPSKAELADAKSDYGQAFDASTGDLKLLEVLARASRRSK